MKKILTVILVMLLAIALFGCTQSQNASDLSENTENNDKIKIITTLFPQYDFARQIAGDKADITLLLPPGAESHSFEPTPSNIIDINNADMFIYTGEYMEPWADRIIQSVESKNLHILDVSSGITLAKEEHDHDHDEGDHDHDHDFDEEDIEDRTIADFAGEWQSIHPFIANGSMDTAIEAASKDGDMSFDEMAAYYNAGMKTEVDLLSIEGDKITLHTESGDKIYTYDYDGFLVLNYEELDIKSVSYRFKAQEDAGTYQYLIFNDHNYKQAPAEHFHLNFSTDGTLTAEQTMEEFPTYFAAGTSVEDMIDAMIAHNTADHDHDHDPEHDEYEDHDHEQDHGHTHEYDPHIWTSPVIAKKMVDNIAASLCYMDPENASYYKENAESYKSKLDELDTEFKEIVNNGKRKTIYFGGRFALYYFTEEYGLEYMSAYDNCSSETEPSVQDIKTIIDEISRDNIPVIYYEELTDPKVSRSISEDTGVEMLLFHSCHNVSKEDFNKGITYLDLMKQNAENLKKGLN